ncbi:hypothetical protein GIS00_12330 [Nakamurella sp. YIM 132087]|uniref:DUF4345 domain-containing protein n=1 Tax=Nakamurella alba TaxID=2665158 RepID=A0A7K1FKT9_9ACTN|nr:hypothetical protein [Nakamurella alba]MTD14728.1 hypothetical protein [Nakamurella alba]
MRTTLLWILNLLGLGVGGWALFLPDRFYDSFPGVGFGAWVMMDGPYNQHLIRDVGALYLGLAAAGIIAVLTRGAAARTAAGRVVAVAWLVFSLPHFLYHVVHLHGMATIDAFGQPVSLLLTVLLPLPLLFPARPSTGRSATTPKEDQR